MASEPSMNEAYKDLQVKYAHLSKAYDELVADIAKLQSANKGLHTQIRNLRHQLRESPNGSH